MLRIRLCPCMEFGKYTIRSDYVSIQGPQNSGTLKMGTWEKLTTPKVRTKDECTTSFIKLDA